MFAEEAANGLGTASLQEGSLRLSSSPHIHSGETIERIMYSVLLALVPAGAASVIFFGSSALKLIAVCAVFAVATEAVWQLARGKRLMISDGSALITGVLLAYNLPPGLPVWMAALGSIVAISIGKQVFGGLGTNVFNPALIGRAFLIAAFPVHMTTWLAPFDGQTTATPLAEAGTGVVSYWDLFIGNIGGCLGETSALALLLGAVYLLYRGYIDWRIPLGYLGTAIVALTLLGEDPLFHVLAGGFMLGAFFMATDMVTTPVTKSGRWIFGVGAGLILVLIRLYGGYPEGCSFSILFMNAVTPLINRFTRPRPLGEARRSA